MTNPISKTAARVLEEDNLLEDSAPLRKHRLELLPKNTADAAMALVQLSLSNCTYLSSSSSSSSSYLLVF